MEKKYVAKIDMVQYEDHTEVEIEGTAGDLITLCAELVDKLAESVHLEPIEFMAYLATRVESARLERKIAERAAAEGEC